MMILITTLAGISCILQNFFGGWEFWMPAVVLIGGVALWYVHFTQKPDSYYRINIYFAYAALLLFYHGVHDTSLFDLSVSVVLFMVTFTMADSIRMLNLILAEYGIVMAIQFWFLYRNGGLNMSAFNGMRIVYHIGTVLIMYVFSRITVSNRVSERERIKRWEESVRENDSDMEDFLSNISHELRTPVNVISGMTAIMQKDNDCKELASIKDAGIRLARQIEDIQDYTEIKRGELHLEEENYMSISLINDVVAYYKENNRNKNLDLVVDIAPETPSMLKGDVKKLGKLLRHLLDNSIKFTRHGGIYIKMFSVPQKYGTNLTIEVTDTGIGMTRGEMSRLSKGMYQANKKRNRSTGGIGTGVPVVYGFVRKMGGFVKIDSSKGRGTTVHISIPQQVVDPAPCLKIEEEAREGLVFFIRPEKYKVPEVREFYRNMAVNLARGLNVKLYSAGEKRELEQVIKELNISHIFTGREEYEDETGMLDYLLSQGYKVVVSADEGYKAPPGSGIMVLPKPLYAFPIVRVLNGEEVADGYGEENKGRLSFDGVRALVVDDEPMNLVVASGLFRNYEMDIDTAESGREAIKKFDRNDYDVIFMDHMMPEMDGVEAMKIIRQAALGSGRKPVIVALTANALSGAREMFIKEGFDGFIAKPIDIAEFERVMKRVLPEELFNYKGRDEQ
ncbi:MAG: response regulator [Lachnospiraceae bacterium]|nr:response regulator [Lachnospiraceae bacterium]